MSHHNSEGRTRRKKRSTSGKPYKPTAYTGGSPSEDDGFGPSENTDSMDFTRPATRPTPNFNKGAAVRAGKRRKHPYSRKEFGD